MLDREFQKHHQNVLSACPHFVIGVFGCLIGVICLIRYSLVYRTDVELVYASSGKLESMRVMMVYE